MSLFWNPIRFDQKKIADPKSDVWKSIRIPAIKSKENIGYGGVDINIVFIILFIILVVVLVCYWNGATESKEKL